MRFSEEAFARIIEQSSEITDTIFDNIQLAGECNYIFESDTYFCNCPGNEITAASVYLTDFTGTVPANAKLKVTVTISDPSAVSSKDDEPLLAAGTEVFIEFGNEAAVAQSAIKLGLTIKCNGEDHFRCRLQLTLTHVRIDPEFKRRLGIRPRSFESVQEISHRDDISESQSRVTP